MNNFAKRGAIGILLMTAIALLTVTIAIGTAAVSFNQLISYGDIPNAHKALAYAESAARDALLRLNGKYDYTTTSNESNTTCGGLSNASTDHCYRIEFVSGGCAGTFAGCARVQVTKPNTAACPTASCSLITVESQAETFIRKIQVTVTFSTNENYLNMVKDTVWTEITS